MQINHSNIEECLFDYFEGNLSEQDKVELMSFIHQHPEYERDFAAWAQSFTMQAEPVKDYKIEKSLLIKRKPFFYHKATYFIFVVLVVACGYFFFKETPKDIPASKATEPTSTQKNIVSEPVIISPKVIAKEVTTKRDPISKPSKQIEPKSLNFADSFIYCN